MECCAVCSTYVSGVSVNLPGVGRVFGGHISPVHKEPGAVPEVNELFQTHRILMGDFNAGESQLRKHIRLPAACEMHNPPSYLPSMPQIKPRIYIPCFDVVAAVGAACEGTHNPRGIGSLPTRVTGTDPRMIMVQRGMPSDHLPILASVSVHGLTVRCFTYNVADPCFWGKAFPSAAAGFDTSKEGEAKRQAKVTDVIRRALSALPADAILVVALQEVPASMEAQLSTLLQSSFRCTVHSTPMHCAPELPFDDAARQLVSRCLLAWRLPVKQ
jgi:hypothetical protein